MRRFGRVSAALGAGLIVGALGLAGPAMAANTTYYVDAEAGSDANAGTSTATAWKSLAKVNATTFSAGDKLLLRSGQTWAGRLAPKGSGAAGNPFTIGAYGEGGRPKIDGGSLAGGGAVSISNQNYVTISGLEVVSNSGVDNLGTGKAGVNRSGIMVDNTSGTGRYGITIKDNLVRDVNGCFVCSGAAGHANGGIVVMADSMVPLSLGSGSWNGVQILDNTVDHVGRTGIVFFDNSTGLLYTVAENALSQNVTIAGNKVTNVDSDGIIISGAKNNLIERNVVDNASLKTVPGSTVPSAAGIWPAKTINTMIQFNEVSRVRTQANVDGQGYDVDLLAVNTTLQHNYSHDNEGGFLLLQGGLFAGSNLTARYNLSVNDAYTGAKGVFTFAYGLTNSAKIYNNTVYVKPGLPSKIFYMDGWSGTTGTSWSFRNNVIVNHGTGGYTTPTGGATTISHNLFFGNHPPSEPADANKITSDPQLVAPPADAPSGNGSVAGYQVAAGSPAVGSGALISGNGGRDYFGRAVSPTAAPTRGFHEAQ